MGEVERFWPQLETTVLWGIGALGVMSRAEDMVAVVQSCRLLDNQECRSGNGYGNVEDLSGVDGTRLRELNGWRDEETRKREFQRHKGGS